MTAPRRHSPAPLVVLLIGLVLAACGTSPMGPSEARPAQVGDVVVRSQATTADAPPARLTVRRTDGEPVVLDAARRGTFDAYFDVALRAEGTLDLDLVDADRPGRRAARLRQTPTDAGHDLRFLPSVATDLTVEYVVEGRVVETERHVDAESASFGESDDPTESVHYYRDGNVYVIVYDFTADEPASVKTPGGTTVERCTEIRVRLDAAVATLGRPALRIGGTGWDEVQLDDGSARRLDTHRVSRTL